MVVLSALYLACAGTAALADADPSPPPSAAPLPTPAPRGYAGDAGYRITVPANWARHEGDVRPLDAIFFSLEDPGVNMSVTVAAAEPDGALTESTAREMREMFRQGYPSYEVTAEAWRDLDGVKAYCLSARYSPAGRQLQNKQVILIKGGKFFTLTYTATPALFMKHLGAFEGAVESFKVTAQGKIQDPQPQIPKIKEERQQKEEGRK